MYQNDSQRKNLEFIRDLQRRVVMLKEKIDRLEKKNSLEEYCINGPRAGREPWQDRSN